MADTGADDRKRKLAEIRAKANKGSTADGKVAAQDSTAANEEQSEESSEKKIKFRNYQPYDKTLKGGDKKEASKENTSEPIVAESSVPVETNIIKLELQKFQGDELNIMPKKPNWDLKVQVEGKLEKLKNRTQKAIVEILREKLAAEAREE